MYLIYIFNFKFPQKNTLGKQVTSVEDLKTIKSKSTKEPVGNWSISISMVTYWKIWVKWLWNINHFFSDLDGQEKQGKVMWYESFRIDDWISQIDKIEENKNVY